MLKYILCLFTLTLISHAQENEPTWGKIQSHNQLPLRTAKWAAKGQKKGTILFLQGMGGHIEAYSTFTARLTDLGFDVITFDWRGQGGSHRHSSEKSLVHVPSFKEYIRDLDTIIKSFHEETVPLYAMALSMGGNILLRYLHDKPSRLQGAVLLAPLVDINTGNYPYIVIRSLATVMSSLGWGERFVFGYKPFELQHCLSRFHPEKHGSEEKYIADCYRQHEMPHLATSGPSFQWLKEAFRSCSKLKDPEYVKSISTPLLILTVPNDHLVDTSAQKTLCDQLPRCHQIIYKDAHHNILKDHDHVIERVITDTKNFFDAPNMFLKDKNTPSTIRGKGRNREGERAEL